MVHLHDVPLVWYAVNKDGMMVDSDAVLSCNVVGSYSLGDGHDDVGFCAFFLCFYSFVIWQTGHLIHCHGLNLLEDFTKCWQ